MDSRGTDNMVVRVWFAVDTSLDMSPPLARFRAEHGSTADSYFYRALAFAKQYARAGAFAEMWPAVAEFVRWPNGYQELQASWRRCGLVFGDADELYQWAGTNGWIQAKKENERKRSERNRKAARIGARKRREARAAAQKPAKRTTNGRSVGG